jgi:hypothetical protein
MEAVFGKVSKGFSDREVAVDLGLDYVIMVENLLEGTQVAGPRLRFSMHMSVGAT